MASSMRRRVSSSVWSMASSTSSARSRILNSVDLLTHTGGLVAPAAVHAAAEVLQQLETAGRQDVTQSSVARGD